MNEPMPPTIPAAAPEPPGAAPRAEGAALSLHIDRVVLEGFALGARDCARLQAALQAELAELLSAQGPGAALLGGAALPGLRAGNLRFDRSHDATRLGRAIAQSLHSRIVS